MKAIFALLAGLWTLSHADESNEALSFSEDSAEETESSYAGLSIGVFLNAGEDDVPQVVLSSENDEDGEFYCYNLERIFEAVNYNLSTANGTMKCTEDCNYELVTGSDVSLGDAGCNATQLGAYAFVLECDSLTFNVTFNFTFIEKEDERTGLEFTIEIEGYTFMSSDPDAVLVLEQSLEDCTATRSVDDSDESDDDDGDDDDDDDDDDSSERRRLSSHDHDHSDEHDHDHSDDSEDSEDENQVGVGSANFELTVTTGKDMCDDGSSSDVDLQLVYQTAGDDNKIHIVIDRFNCTLTIDPFVGLEKFENMDYGERFALPATSVFAVVAMMVTYMF